MPLDESMLNETMLYDPVDAKQAALMNDTAIIGRYPITVSAAEPVAEAEAEQSILDISAT